MGWKRFSLGRTGGLLVLACVLPDIAAAYIDPGSGSTLIQVLIGFAAGALVALKIYWQRLRAFFSGKKQGRDPIDE